MSGRSASRRLHLDRRLATWPSGLGRPLAVAFSVVTLAWGLVLFNIAIQGWWGSVIGLDLGHYLDGARRWLDTGSPYLPNEVAGPFDYEVLTFLHPPIALLLFAPFLVLPAVVWWLPIPILAWSVWSWKPAAWTWPLLAVCVADPHFHESVLVGNSDMWIAAAVALGLRYGWPALLVVVKPSLIPFMVAGAGHRSTWIGLGAVVLLSLPFAGLWVEWLQVVVNSPAAIAYSIAAVPMVLIPVIAWMGARDGRVPDARDANGSASRIREA